MRKSLKQATVVGFCAAVFGAGSVTARSQTMVAAATLPDSPGAVRFSGAEHDLTPGAGVAQTSKANPPCTPAAQSVDGKIAPGNLPGPPAAGQVPCPFRKHLDTVVNKETDKMHPLTPNEKGMLAIKSVANPFNLLATAAQSGINVATNAHSVYGPGLKGWGKEFGYDLVQESTGSFFAVYAIPVLAHEDPRYRRDEGAPIWRRVVHAASRTVIAQHDDGRNMPNYATLVTYPITAEIANLYVPGVQSNGPDTAKRIAYGLLSDPIGNLIAEFLPDIAKRIHVHAIFVQQIINQLAQPAANPSQ